MNRLLVTLLTVTVVSMSVFPTGTRGGAVPTADAQPSELEPPHALPLAASATATAAATVGAAAAAPAAQPQLNNDLGEIWQEDDREVLIRNARRAKDNINGAAGAGAAAAGAGTGSGAGNGAAVDCRYTKSPWSDCDLKTNTRSRTLSLKRGDACVQTRTIQKKCKKACRYEKGAWTECTSGQMSRSDRLKTASDPTCQQTRDVTKNCNQGKPKADKKDRPAKNGKQDKGQRKSGRA